MIYCKVRVVVSELPMLVDQDKLEVFAVIESEQYRKLDAERVAQNCADAHGVAFEVVEITERAHGRYRPKGLSNGGAILEKP